MHLSIPILIHDPILYQVNSSISQTQPIQTQPISTPLPPHYPKLEISLLASLCPSSNIPLLCPKNIPEPLTTTITPSSSPRTRHISPLIPCSISCCIRRARRPREGRGRVRAWRMERCQRRSRNTRAVRFRRRTYRSRL
jgi:hypothetical protein